MEFSTSFLSPANDQSEQQGGVNFFKIVRNLALFCLFLLTLYSAAVLSMWASWDNADWSIFWEVAIGYLVLIPSIIGVVFMNSHQYTPPPTSNASANHLLRLVLVNASDRILPRDPVQPVPLEGESAKTLEEHFDSLSSRVPAGAAPGCLLTTVCIAGIIPLIVGFTSFNLHGSTVLIVLAFFSPLVPISVILLVVGAWRSRREPHAVTTDLRGITWQSGIASERKRIDWHQARAFVRSNTTGESSAISKTTFMLASSDELFSWAVPNSPKIDVLIDSDRLSRLIVTRTELPLRNASQFMREIGTSGKNLPRLVESRGLTQGIPPDVLQQALKASNPPVPLRSLRIAAAIVGLLLVLMPFVAGGWMQWYDSSYFSSLNQHIPSEMPLYQDSLAQPDGFWPKSPLSKNSDFGYAYTNGAYELHGTLADQTENALLDGPTFGSAAYAVTAVENGTVPANQTDGIGIIMHANTDQSDFLVFYVKYDSGWALYHYHEYGPNDPDNWDFLDSGSNSAIHQGPGAENRLMAVTYSDSIALFVNGQFIKQFKPSTYNPVDLSRTGSAGVYLNTSTMMGDFTNFTVSPAPPSDFWGVVQTLNPLH
jgi:hypothetical protein